MSCIENSNFICYADDTALFSYVNCDLAKAEFGIKRMKV